MQLRFHESHEIKSAEYLVVLSKSKSGTFSVQSERDKILKCAETNVKV